MKDDWCIKVFVAGLNTGPCGDHLRLTLSLASSQGIVLLMRYQSLIAITIRGSRTDTDSVSVGGSFHGICRWDNLVDLESSDVLDSG